MTAYYNEIDPYCAAWLRNLIDAKHVARGDVDERRAVRTTSARDRMDFADYIAGLRDIYKMSQQDFAAKLGISPQYLCDLENRRRMPSVSVVDKICDCFAPRGAAGDGFRRRYHRAGARAHGWMV